MPRRVEIRFAVPREVAFDFLVDPRNRMRWQPSLRSVGEVAPVPPQEGTRWRERATGGIVSAMELTVVERPARWAEYGSFRGLSMDLALEFEEDPGGCLVIARMEFGGNGSWRAVAAVASGVFPYAVRRDLTRAARILAEAGR